jgi:hypothetical protein
VVSNSESGSCSQQTAQTFQSGNRQAIDVAGADGLGGGTEVRRATTARANSPAGPDHHLSQQLLLS